MIISAQKDRGAADIVESGKRRGYCNYTLDSDGTLTISGSGKMYDYRTISSNKNCTQDSAPWSGRGESIKKVMIKTGVTYVGNSAFERLPELERVLIPEGVTSIGKSAFRNNKAITDVEIPVSVKRIESQAFEGCEALMQQKLAGWDVKDFNEAAADVTGDGVFNSEDIAHFQKYLAGWNLLLGV